MLLIFILGYLNGLLLWKEPFILSSVRVLRERLSICVCVSFPFGFEGEM